ncbi:23197_t:CDS:2 [Gigaspora margarita]|uniref:23197_t:CDS:1 n=1 Tax=Gigaspora margarita TaxID=4874 RepID=A0ABN7VQV0_GIGMA|nr:23197_t:CDS:2 [Gigaspora margarita]
MENEFFKGEKFQIEKEAKTAYKRDLNTTTKIELTVSTSSRKVILELLECGTTDYGTDEVQKQITNQELKQAKEIEEFIKNRYKEVIVKEVIDSPVQDEKNPMMISCGPDSRSLKESLNETNPREENIYSSIWAPKSKDIPSPILQKSEIYNFTLWNILKEVQANRIRRYLNFYRKATIERKKFRTIIKNLPKDTMESSMLRQFKNINAKMVHIPENSNEN